MVIHVDPVVQDVPERREDEVKPMQAGPDSGKACAKEWP
jgi:hypothetical protein